MAIRILLSVIACVTLLSCSKKGSTATIPQQCFHLKESGFAINKEDLARIEGMQCNDSILIVWDFHSGESFTLFNIHTGNCYGRFGTIGQGPDEIPVGTGGYITKNQYKIFNCIIGYIGQYNLDSLRVNIKHPPHVLSRRTFNDDFFFSAIYPINDSLYFGAGVYGLKDQYALFDNQKNVIHSSVLIYNAFNDGFDKSQKILSNQGRLTKSPNADKFAFFLNNSANVDFIEIVGNKINTIKLRRERDPIYTPFRQGSTTAVFPDKNAPNGYIDITSGKKQVYALYSEKEFALPRNSNIVYVFDWQGNPVKQLKLTKEAFYITVNESETQLFAAIKEEDGGWAIISYNI